MKKVLSAVMLSGIALGPAVPAQTRVSSTAAAIDAAASRGAAGLSDIPPLPRGKSTVFGGEIRELDPVRDQLTLKVSGERPMKILFDERTEVYRDGKRVPLRDVRPEEHASVQTTLDGSKIFAVSIHMLSNADRGEYEGRVLSFDPSTGELEVAAGRSKETIKMHVANSTLLERAGQSAFTSQRAGTRDLAAGALISAQFGSSGKDEPIASRITVLAVPGSSFVFGGTVAALDLPAGLMILVDARDQKSYSIALNQNLPAVQQLHVGDKVRVVTNYDGSNYVASEITKELSK